MGWLSVDDPCYTVMNSDRLSCLEIDTDYTHLSEKMDLVDLKPSSRVQAWSKPSSNFFKISHSTFIQGFGNLNHLLWALIPTYVRSIFFKTSEEQGKLHNTAYLDGMRGLAAFAVFLCHLSYDTFDLTHVYGTGGPGQNRSLLQLPIVRLLYSGPPQVAIFFVISGYVLSYKPLKLMRAHQHDDLLAAMSSSVFRRALRLFLPCFASTFIAASFAQVGLYKMTEDFAHHMRAHHEDSPWTAPNPISQLLDWKNQMFDFVNIFDWSLYSGSIPLDRHLWTIPVEMRCSMALFLSHLMVARMSTKARLSTLIFLLWWSLKWNRWDFCPFLAGAILAELDLRKLAVSLDTELADTNLGLGKRRVKCSNFRTFRYKLTYLVMFVIGLFLASYPDADGHIAPGYVHLDRMIPSYFTERHRFWPTIGAIMIVWSCGNLAGLKRMLNSSLVQYLGKISFPLYVMHGTMIHTVGYMTMNQMLNITGYDEENPLRFQIGFCAAALATIAATVCSADIFLRAVDVNCVKFARWLEGKFFDS